MKYEKPILKEEKIEIESCVMYASIPEPGDTSIF